MVIWISAWVEGNLEIVERGRRERGGRSEIRSETEEDRMEGIAGGIEVVGGEETEGGQADSMDWGWAKSKTYRFEVRSS
jgi:hypothetical protein